MGRFISEDPIGFAAGDANLSRYVGNSTPNAVGGGKGVGNRYYEYGRFGSFCSSSDTFCSSVVECERTPRRTR